ncbi:MAG: alpha/beta hydrolase-fold protein [Mycobacterium sp.]|nr:alpha/beta hydrolase-fold protein [Mycobacterium sp.]
MNIGLLHGWLPNLIQAVTVVVLALAIGRRSPRWLRRWLPAAVGAGIVLALACGWFIADQGLAGGPVPISLWVWLILTGLALVVAVAGWRDLHWWRRALSIAVVPLCALCAGLAVNTWTGYLPTVEALWQRSTGAALNSQIDQDAALSMRKAGQRPDHGVVVSVQIPNDASGFHSRPEMVYLPPAWFSSDAPQLPAVVMVGGEFGWPADWPTAGGAQRTADDFAAVHGGNAPILVFVDTSGEFSNDTECVNGPRGMAADHLTEDVVPYIVSEFSASPDPSRWGIAGWSAGGTCAVMTTVMHPELFQSFVDMDGQVGPNAGSKGQTIARLFGGDAAAFDAFDPATVVRKHGPYSGVAGWFAVSEEGPAIYRSGRSGPVPDLKPPTNPENHTAVADYLCALVSSVGIDCAVVPHGGDHTFPSAAQAFATALPWLAGRLHTPGAPVIALPGAAPQ